MGKGNRMGGAGTAAGGRRDSGSVGGSSQSPVGLGKGQQASPADLAGAAVVDLRVWQPPPAGTSV